MIKVNPRFVGGPDGRRTDVILDVQEFEALMAALEDQMDAADLNEAAAQERDFVPYDQFRQSLSVSDAPPA